jgi:hypothetical protein
MGQLRFRDQTARALVAPPRAEKKAYHQLFRQFLVCSNKSFCLFCVPELLFYYEKRSLATQQRGR